MMKKILLLLFIFSAALFSCSQKEEEVQFSHAVHFDSTLKIYEFIIQNISGRNLLIIVDGLYLQSPGKDGRQYILDASSEVFSERYFEPLNTKEFDQSVLDSALLAKTDPKYREDFKFLTNVYYDFPIFLFIKSRSTFIYKYKLHKNLPKGKYIMYLGWDYLRNNKKIKKWKKELRRINKIGDYFYTDINTQTEKGFSFEIK